MTRHPELPQWLVRPCELRWESFVVTLVDLAPTVCAMLGVRVPANLTGRPWTELFDHDLQVQKITSDAVQRLDPTERSTHPSPHPHSKRSITRQTRQ